MDVTFEMMEKAQAGMERLRAKKSNSKSKDLLTGALLTDAVEKWNAVDINLRKKMIAGIELFICDLSQRLVVATEAFVYDPEDTTGQIRKELESVVAARDVLWFASGEQR